MNNETPTTVDNRSLEKKLQALSLGENVCFTEEEKQKIENLEEALLDEEACRGLLSITEDKTKHTQPSQKRA